MKCFRLSPSVPYSLRGKNKLYSRNPKTVTYRTGLISFLAPKIWSIVPNVVTHVGYVKLTWNMLVFVKNYVEFAFTYFRFLHLHVTQ